jgi:hypothetical protein
MKKILLISAFLFISFAGWSQDLKKDRILPAQMSSGELKDSTCIITIDDAIGKGEYYIFTTDIDKALDLYVVKKEKTYFIVKSRTSKDGVFDYVVYVKRLINIENPKGVDNSKVSK